MLCRALSTAKPWAGVTLQALLCLLVSPGLLYVLLLCLRSMERQEGRWLSGMFLFPSPLTGCLSLCSNSLMWQASSCLHGAEYHFVPAKWMIRNKPTAKHAGLIKFRRLPSHRFCCVSNKDQQVLQHLWDSIALSIVFTYIHQLGLHPWENPLFGGF